MHIVASLYTAFGVNDTRHTSNECLYAECRVFQNVMLSVVTSVISLNVVKPSAIIPSVIVLSVMAPLIKACVHWRCS